MEVEKVDDQIVEAYIGEWLAIVRRKQTNALVYEPHERDREALAVSILTPRAARFRRSDVIMATPSGVSFVRLDNLDRFQQDVKRLPTVDTNVLLGPCAYGINEYNEEAYDILSSHDRWARGKELRSKIGETYAAGAGLCTGIDGAIDPSTLEQQVAETPCLMCGEERDTADRTLMLFDHCVDYECIGTLRDLLDNVWNHTGAFL